MEAYAAHAIRIRRAAQPAPDFVDPPRTDPARRIGFFGVRVRLIRQLPLRLGDELFGLEKPHQPLVGVRERGHRQGCCEGTAVGPDAEDDLIRERVAQRLPPLERHVVLGRRDATGQPEPDILAGDGDPRLNAERRRSRIAKIDVRAEVLVYHAQQRVRDSRILTGADVVDSRERHLRRARICNRAWLRPVDDEPDRKSDDEPSARDQRNGSRDARRNRPLQSLAERGGVGPAILRRLGDGAL